MRIASIGGVRAVMAMLCLLICGCESVFAPDPGYVALQNHMAEWEALGAEVVTISADYEAYKTQEKDFHRRTIEFMASLTSHKRAKLAESYNKYEAFIEYYQKRLSEAEEQQIDTRKGFDDIQIAEPHGDTELLREFGEALDRFLSLDEQVTLFRLLGREARLNVEYSELQDRLFAYDQRVEDWKHRRDLLVQVVMAEQAQKQLLYQQWQHQQQYWNNYYDDVPQSRIIYPDRTDQINQKLDKLNTLIRYGY